MKQMRWVFQQFQTHTEGSTHRLREFSSGPETARTDPQQLLHTCVPTDKENFVPGPRVAFPTKPFDLLCWKRDPSECPPNECQRSVRDKRRLHLWSISADALHLTANTEPSAEIATELCAPLGEALPLHPKFLHSKCGIHSHGCHNRNFFRHPWTHT